MAIAGQWYLPQVACRVFLVVSLIELTCETTLPSAQTLFGGVAAPCNPSPLSRTPQLSANTVRG